MKLSTDVMYDIPTVVLVGTLLALMLLGLRFGYRIGDKTKETATDEARSQAAAVQAAILGMLALLLGFTFSLSLSRYDVRSTAVVEEANAIGTAWQRISFLDPEAQDDTRADFRRYVQLRVEASTISAEHAGQRAEAVREAGEVFDRLWAGAVAEVQANGGPDVVSYATALNAMSDELGSREAAINRHVPEIVLTVMYATLVISSLLLGYGSGLTGLPPTMPIYFLTGIIALLVFVIVDLDRPRRGLITVDQTPMTELLETLRSGRG